MFYQKRKGKTEVKQKCREGAGKQKKQKDIKLAIRGDLSGSTAEVLEKKYGHFKIPD